MAEVEVLVENHRRFLAFLENRVGDRALAEELLQSAFVRGLEKAGEVRDDEKLVAWFYRLLRNALTDHFRRRAAESRALDRHADESPATFELDAQFADAVCQCVGRLLPTLEPEYGALLRRVDLEDTEIAVAADELGISPNNTRVRLHRARQALREAVRRTCGTCVEHGCLDCTCKEACAP